MRDVRNEVGLLSETMEGISAIGRTLTFAVTVPLITLGTYAVQAASEFDSAMRDVNSILQLTEGEFGTLSDAVLGFGSTIRGGPVAASEALRIAASAGISEVETAMGFMEIASRTAEAGLADLRVTTEALVASFLAYGGDKLPITEQLELLADQSDILTQTVQVGVGEMNVFANALGKVVPNAVALDVSFSDLGASMAFLTQRGLNAATAGTSLNSAMTALLKPSDAMKAAFTELGVVSGEELVSKFGGLEEALIAVINTADGSATSLRQLFQNQQAARAINLMASDIAGLTDTVAEFQASVEGATDRAHEQQMMSFAAHWDLMTSAISGAAIAIGDDLLPVLLPAVDSVRDVALNIGDLNPQVIGMGLAFAGAAAAAGPILWLLSSLVNPISALILATGALATAFATDFLSIRTNVQTAITDIFGDMSGLTSVVDEIITTLFPPNAEELIAQEVPTVTITPADLVTIEAGDNLWSIWMEGYTDQFTWAAFKEAVGWGDTLTTLLPGDIIRIPTNFGGQMMAALGEHALDSGDVIHRLLGMDNVNRSYDLRTADLPTITGLANDANEAAGLANTLQVRVQNALDIFTTRLGPMLGGMVETARAWFDDKVGEGLNWFASLFEGAGGSGGNTKLYTAVAKLLDLDIGGAIDTFFPGLGTRITEGVSGWGDALAAAFPNIRAAADKLITNVADWMITEGIPTLARTAGHIAGSLASALYDGLALAVQFFTSPATGQAVAGIGDYISGTIGPEIAAGFSEALDGTALQTEGIPALQTAFTQIGGFLDLLNVDALVSGLGSLGPGIAGFVNEISGADWSGVQHLLEGAVKIAGGVLMIGNSVVGAALANLGDWLPVAGSALSSFINILALPVGSSPDAVLDALASGLTGLVGSLLMIPAGVIDTVVNLIETIGNIDLQLPDLTEAVGAWVDNIQTDIENRQIALGTITAVPGGVRIVVEDSDKLDIALEHWEDTFPGITNAVNEHLASHPIEAEAGEILLQISSSTQFVPLNEQANQFMLNWEPLNVQAEAGELTFIFPEGTQGVLDPSSPLPTLAIDRATGQLADLTFDASNTTIQNAPDIAEEILPTGTLAEHMDAETAAAMAGLGNTILSAVAAGGSADPQAITDNFLLPIQQNFLAYLGPESETVATLLEFLGTAGDVMNDVGDKMAELAIRTGVHMTGIRNKIYAEAPLIKGQFDSIKASVDGLISAMDTLAGAAASALDAALRAAAAPQPASASISGYRALGGDVMAGNTYVVGERGPELFTAPGNGTIIPNDALFGGNRGGSGGDTYYNTITITEANNLDAILLEAKRRGIQLAPSR